MHSPPEVKGIMLDAILYDWWLTPSLSEGREIKIGAVKKAMESFQGWRDFEETLERMNSDGRAKSSEFDRNLERLFEFVGSTKSERNLFVRQLKNRKAIAGRPVRRDPFGACRICGLA